MSLLGRDDQVVTEWLLKADQFKQELSELARDIKAQQRNENDLALVRKKLDEQTKAVAASQDSFKAALEKVNAAILKTNDLLGKFSVGTELLKGGLRGLGEGAFNFVIDKCKELGSHYVNLIKEGERKNLVLDDMAEAADRMAAATKNLADDDDMLRLRSKLSAGQIKLTEQQYDSFAKAAARLSQTMKIDMSQAVDQVADSYLRANSRGLKPLGIEIGKVNDLLDGQTKILEAVGGKFGDYEVQLTAAQRRLALNNQLKQSEEELGQTIARIGIVRDLVSYGEETKKVRDIAWNKAMTEQWEKNRLAIDDATFSLAAFFNSAGLVEKLKKAVQEVRAEFELMDKAAKQAIDDAGGWDLEEGGLQAFLGGKNRRLDEQSGGPSARSLMGGVGALGKGSGKGGWDISGRGRSGSKGGTKRTGGGKAKWDKGNAFIAGKDPKAWADRILGEKEEAELHKQMMPIIEEESRARTAREQSLKKETEAIWASHAAWEKQHEAQRKVMEIGWETNAALKEMAKGGIADFASGLWSAADAAIQSGESFGVAMAKMLKATLLSIATESTVKAVYQVAEAIAAAARYDYKAAGEHMIAAGKFAGVAVLAGGIGLGISAATAPARTAATAKQEPKATPTQSTPYKPEYGKKSEKSQPIYVQVYLGDGNDPGAILFATRQVEARLKAAA